MAYSDEALVAMATVLDKKHNWDTLDGSSILRVCPKCGADFSYETDFEFCPYCASELGVGVKTLPISTTEPLTDALDAFFEAGGKAPAPLLKKHHK